MPQAIRSPTACRASAYPSPPDNESYFVRPTQGEIEAAAAGFQGPEPTLEQLMAGTEPIRSMDQLDIPDLTGDEREAFAAALDPA